MYHVGHSGGFILNNQYQADFEDLDREWVDLILIARELGFSVEDIRNFLRELSSQPV
jgi:DNA-binding transcriptional MerR regulator